MFTREIPRRQWPKFLNDFSRDHNGWFVSLEVRRSVIGNQLAAASKPLLGVSPDGDAISISVGTRPDTYIDHRVTDAEHIWLEQNDEKNDVALQIDSSDGTKTLLRFRTTMNPAMLDRNVE